MHKSALNLNIACTAITPVSTQHSKTTAANSLLPWLRIVPVSSKSTMVELRGATLQVFLIKTISTDNYSTNNFIALLPRGFEALTSLTAQHDVLNRCTVNQMTNAKMTVCFSKHTYVVYVCLYLCTGMYKCTIAIGNGWKPVSSSDSSMYDCQRSRLRWTSFKVHFTMMKMNEFMFIQHNL